jgi:hypothetical protein
MLQGRAAAGQQSTGGQLRGGWEAIIQNIQHPDTQIGRTKAANEAADTLGLMPGDYRSLWNTEEQEKNKRRLGFTNRFISKLSGQAVDEEHEGKFMSQSDFDDYIKKLSPEQRIAGIGQTGPSGESIGAQPLYPDPHPSQYSWTSFSGMAEQMQMMWSGAPIDNNTMAMQENTTALKENTVALAGGGGGSHYVPTPGTPVK